MLHPLARSRRRLSSLAIALVATLVCLCAAPTPAYATKITVAAVELPGFYAAPVGATVYLIGAATRGYIENVGGVPIQPGEPPEVGKVAKGPFYRKIACTVANVGGVPTLQIPQVVLDSTTDGVERQDSLVRFAITDANGKVLALYGGFERVAIPHQAPSTTWAAIRSYNFPNPPPAPAANYFTAAETLALIAAGGGSGGNPFVTFAGPTASRTYTLPDASSTLLATSGIGSQTQAWSGELDALAGVNTSGVLFRNGSSSWAARSLLASDIPPLAYLPTAGGTLTGALTLPGNPSSALQAAPKQYVDTSVSALASVYAPLSHTHAAGDVTSGVFSAARIPDLSATYQTTAGLAEAIDDRTAALLVAGTGVTLTYSDVAGTLTIDAAGGAGGVSSFNTRTGAIALTSGDVTTALGAPWTDLTDAGDSTAHYHAADRARANHTGTQLASTISDLGALGTLNSVANAQVASGAAIAVNKLAAVTASRALVSDGSGFLSPSSVTATELGYVSGATSALQTQIDGKAALSHTHAAGDVTSGTFAAARVAEVLGASDLTDYSGTSGSGATAIRATITSPSTGDRLTWSGTNWINQAPTSGGTVTSVDLTAPAIFTVSGNPVTVSGALALSLATETANAVWAGPSSGGAAAPTFRALVAADIPSLSGTYAAASHTHAASDVTSGSFATSFYPSALLVDGTRAGASSATTGAAFTLGAVSLTSGSLLRGTVPASGFTGRIVDVRDNAGSPADLFVVGASGAITAGTIPYASVTGRSVVDADVASGAAIGWTKISKSGSSLADLATRSAADLSSGTLALARLAGITTAELSATAGIVSAQINDLAASKLTGPLPAISGASLTSLDAGAVAAGTLAVARGGTGLGSGTSGGVLYYSSSSALASSGALTANAIVLGGGAGAAPTVLGSLGTTTTVLHGNASGAPTFSAVGINDVSGSTGTGSFVFATSPTLTTPSYSGDIGTDFNLGTHGTTVTIANASSTGTTVNRLAKLTGAPSTAVIAATSDTGGMVGLVVSGAGTSGSAKIAVSGQATADFDGSTTAGDYVVISTTTAGKVHDSGSTYPTSGQVLGRVLTTNGSSGAYTMQLYGPELQASSGSGANAALSNLASVAINTALLPGLAAGSDFGSATKPWGKLWFAGGSGTPGTNNFNLTGTATAGRTITFPDASINVARSDAAQTLTGTQTLSISNTLSALSATGASLVLENSAGASQQSLFVFTMSGTVKGGLRVDSQGNFNWHSLDTQGHQFYCDLAGSVPVMALSSAGLVVGNAAGDRAAYKLEAKALDAGTTVITDVFSPSHNSSGTPSTGFGTGILLRGKSSTTLNRDMARISAVWTTATDASRTSKVQIWQVTSAGALASCAEFDMGASTDDIGLYLWDFTAGTLKRVSRGASDSGGVGFRLLRVAN